MSPVRLLARPMLASAFVAGGADQLLNPDRVVDLASNVTEPIGEAVDQATGTTGSTPNDRQMVQLNGAAQVVGGALLALGKMPRLAALLLAGSLVPTTLAGHRFWEVDDAKERVGQRTQFLKNLSMLGGLLIATMDLEGRPGLAWRAGHTVDHAKIAAEHAAEVARLRTELTKKKLTPDVSDLSSLVSMVRSGSDSDD